MKPKFKDRAKQTMYEVCRRLGADRTSEFWVQPAGTVPRRGAGHRNAYWNGYNGEPSRYLRTSLNYAAWAAGRDNERAGR